LAVSARQMVERCLSCLGSVGVVLVERGQMISCCIE